MRKFSISLILILSFLAIFSSLTVAKNYEEIPMFKTKVKSGELPPMKDRIPKDPYVAKPVDDIGQYGGTVNTVTVQPKSWGEDIFMMAPFANLIRPTPAGKNFVNHLANNIEVKNNMTTYTIHLREGTKWSDGHPFTAEDIMFWYEDILTNQELTPAISSAFKAEGEVVNVKKLDKYTVKFTFAEPKPYFRNRLAVWSGNVYAPKHYLKQFHPNYVSKNELTQKVKEAGFDNWWELFQDKNYVCGGVPMNPDLPCLTAYRLKQISSSRRILERNPYYWKVDTEGNQLPYIDKIKTDLVSNKELVNGKILDGNVDFAVFNTDVRNYPMYKKYEEKSGYKTILLNGLPNSVIYMINMTHQEPELRKIFQDLRFRKALSFAIDREEINETIYYGKAEPRQCTVADSSQWYKPEYAEAYVEYNPEKAKDLLNEIGIVDKDGDGWRERFDGRKLDFTIEYYALEAPKTPNAELVSEYWREIGIDVDIKNISGQLQMQRAPANLLDATLFHGHCATDTRFPVQPNYWVPIQTYWETSIWPLWGDWFASDGEEGEEPPAEIKELYNWWQEMITEPNKQKRLELGHKILKSQAENLWSIGTVGNGPYPLIVDKNLGNVPTDGTFTSSTGWSWCTDPSLFYFKE